ncbi:DUF692 domain-containing protein [Calidifontibacter sp. DB0510]|uniref:DUF692 domain-containing protein n=1 Tax=Metallococcus carri TaxID=1656884 RepID=A0A967E9E9_9MICO|nr:DUF692 domain-containing protein [Metallococcus carri]NHN56312.1 DUF692 domain-containing protein [Metallococcus carri]NOP38636.1 DUF692 domain-containing protein [Calidifontibacter sp. DB2511S]
MTGISELRGTAVAWRRPIAEFIAALAADDRITFTEVVAENVRPDRLPTELTALRRAGVAIVPHGVTLGLADASRPDADRLQHLADLAEALDSPVISEHVAFVRGAATPDPLHGDVLEAGHLLPPPRTRDSLAVLVENVREAQQALPRPLAVENIAALMSWPEDELDEPDFLTELVDRTGVHLVLDVANLYASATARGTDPAAELARFPLEQVAYVHVAGGTERDGLYLDTHAHPVRDEVTALVTLLTSTYADRCLPLPGIMLERDADITAAAVSSDLDRINTAVAQGVSHAHA